MREATVHVFHKNSEEKVVAQLTEYKGFRLADLRVYYQADDSTFRPSKKGLCISLDLLPELAEAVRKLREAAGGEGEDEGEDAEGDEEGENCRE